MARTAVLTEAEKATRQKERCRRWHRKITAERRCHWCGEPSCEEYANACEKHLELTRGTNAYLKDCASNAGDVTLGLATVLALFVGLLRLPITKRGGKKGKLPFLTTSLGIIL